MPLERPITPLWIHVYHTLGAIQKKQVRQPGKSILNKNLRFVAAVAIVCILLAGMALAATNTWGVLDFPLRETG